MPPNTSLLKRIAQAVEKQRDDMTEVKITLAEQHVSLQEHIRRTAAIEGALTKHFEADERANGALSERLTPLENARQQFIGVKTLLVLAVIPLGTELLHLFWKH